MLTFHVLSLWAIVLHVISCISPAALVALANYHVLKARANANVINWKARNKYNNAISKSKTNLAHLNKGSKARKTRDLRTDDDKNKKNEEKLPTDDFKDDNQINENDYLVDDSFMIHERTPQEQYDYAPLDVPDNEEYQKFELYGDDLDVFPENIDFQNGAYSTFIDNYEKAALHHHNHQHHHQHGFVHFHTHEHGSKPVHQIDQHQYEIPQQTHITNNQQTTIHHLRPPTVHHEVFPQPDYGGQHKFGMSSHSVAPGYSEHKGGNNQIIINQNQVVNENILKARQVEEENEAFQRSAMVPNDETVSTFELGNLDPYNQYASEYPQPYYYSPLDFDPKKPDNKQPLVKYIEDQEKAMKHLLENIKHNNENLLDYDKQQKKYLLEYEKQQKKYVLEYEKKQKKYLKEFEEHNKKSLLDDKKDKFHVPKDPQYAYGNNYNSYSNQQPSETYPIPLPPALPSYEIKNDKVKPPVETLHSDVIPTYAYDQNTNVSPQKETVYNGENSADINQPTDHSDGVNPQYSDPFYSWVSNYPGYGQPTDHLQLRAEDAGFKRTSEDSLAQERIPLENVVNYYPTEFDYASHENARDAEHSDEQILTELLLNHPNIDEKIGMVQDNPRVEYIFQVPYQNSEYSKRESRSVKQKEKSIEDITNVFNKQEEILDSLLALKNKQLSKSLDNKTITTEEVANILKKQKEILGSLKTDADEGLQLIQDIGSNLIGELEDKLNKTRVKRQERKQEMLWKRLFTEPNVHLDMPKTLENVGTATRTTFEDENSPMYHVRNMAGSTKDAIIAAMKIPNQNFIIPSKYDIIKLSRGRDRLGDINTKLFSRGRALPGIDQEIQEGIENTFNKVGSVIKSTIQSGQESLAHVAHIGEHAKKAVYNTRHSTPRVISRARSNARNKETVIISPKLIDIYEDNRVGTPTVSDSNQDFIKFGDLLDSIGASNPQNNLKYQKIVLRPRNPYRSINMRANRIPDFIKSGLDFENNKIVGDTLNTLEVVKKTFGVKTLKEFFMNMKRMLKKLWKQNMSESNASYKDNKVHLISRGGDPSKSHDTGTLPAKSLKSETVGDDLLLPEELLHPFMKQPSEAQIHDFFARYNQKSNENGDTLDRNPTVGAINTRILERIEDKLNDRSNHKQHVTHDNETLSTSMALQGNMVKPFMGYLKNKKKKPMKEEPMYNKEQNYDSEWPVYTYSAESLYEPQDESTASYEETIYL